MPADDAGATTVAFMLDCTAYPTRSLLGAQPGNYSGAAITALGLSAVLPATLGSTGRESAEAGV